MNLSLFRYPHVRASKTVEFRESNLLHGSCLPYVKRADKIYLKVNFRPQVADPPVIIDTMLALEWLPLPSGPCGTTEKLGLFDGPKGMPCPPRTPGEIPGGDRKGPTPSISGD